MGSKDMNTRVYGTEPYNNLIVNSIGGHSGAIIGAFFEKDSLNVSFIYFTKLYGYFWTWYFANFAKRLISSLYALKLQNEVFVG